MITCDKLRLYNEFNGELDMWSRTHSHLGKSATEKAEAEELEYAIYGDIESDWRIIDELIQGQLWIVKGIVAEDYKRTIETKFKVCTADEQTRLLLLKMVNDKLGA